MPSATDESNVDRFSRGTIPVLFLIGGALAIGVIERNFPKQWLASRVKHLTTALGVVSQSKKQKIRNGP